jgi:putative PIN family toxin of toxin-antitoxin system
MRALLDTNLFISYLLSRSPEASSVGAILGAARDKGLTLLFTPGIADEIRATVADRPDLAAKIGADDIDVLLGVLDVLAEEIPRISEEVPRIGRNPKDDYLIAHAVVAGADYLVSWDKDLLDLGAVEGVAIVDPPRLLHALRAAGRLA